MIEVKDRVSARPNRIKITPDGGTPYYATWERADEPIEEGTPVNKMLFDSIEEGGFSFSALDDVDMDAQSVNLAAGWTKVQFTKPFIGIPRVLVSSSGAYLLSVQNVTRTSCEISARQITSGSYYVATKSGATPTTQVDLFTALEFVAVKVDVLAVYDGGYTI